MSQYPETVHYHYHPLKTIWFLPLLGLTWVLAVRRLTEMDTWGEYALALAITLLMVLLCIHYVHMVWLAFTRKPVLSLTEESLQMRGEKPVLWTDIEDIQEGDIFLKKSYTGGGWRNKLERLVGRRQKVRLPIELLKGRAKDIDEVLYEYHRQAIAQEHS